MVFDKILDKTDILKYCQAERNSVAMKDGQKGSIRYEKSPSDLLALLDKDFLRGLLEDFTQATGLTANIISIEGRSIFSRADAQKNCTFCRLVRELERKKGINRCVAAYRRAGLQAVGFDEPYIFRCPAGLVEWVAPIKYDGLHIGSVVCGQVLMWEPEDFFWVELEQKNRMITDDIQPLIEATKELQVVPTSKVQAASRLLAIIANTIMESVLNEVKRKNDLAYQARLLDKERDTRRELERKLNASSATYLRDQARGLVKTLKAEDFDEAQRVFTVLLADIVSSSSSFSEAYASMFDVILTVSHHAIDSGVDPDECMKTNLGFCKAERFSSRLEELGEAAESTFAQQLGLIRTHTKPRKRAVEAMLGYIKSHLNVNFSLADVAASVDLSPYYASRIFREDQNMTIMDYAVQLRMDEACYLLSNPNLRIDEIAAQLGYVDSSYFARVFKKKVGMSPRQYRLSH